MHYNDTLFSRSLWMGKIMTIVLAASLFLPFLCYGLKTRSGNIFDDALWDGKHLPLCLLIFCVSGERSSFQIMHMFDSHS